VAIAGSYLRFKDAPVIKGMTRGVSLAVVGLLAAVIIDLAWGAISGPADVLIGFVAFVAAGPLKLDPIAVLLGAALVGLARYLIGV
jgi:chromate transport protein ChrA